jgi:hypothetical protein
MHREGIQHRIVRQDTKINAHTVDPTATRIFDSDLHSSAEATSPESTSGAKGQPIFMLVVR